MEGFVEVNTFVLTATSGVGTNYLVISQTQGYKMMWNAYSMATHFTSVHQARSYIPKMQEQYKGLSNWKAKRVTEDY